MHVAKKISQKRDAGKMVLRGTRTYDAGKQETCKGEVMHASHKPRIRTPGIGSSAEATGWEIVPML